MRMVLSLLLIASSARAMDADPYYGKRSYQAILRFDHRVVFRSAHPPTQKEAKRKIDDQVLHLFGPLAGNKRRAVPKTDEKITSIRISPLEDVEGAYSARYHYEGHIVVQGEQSGPYPIVLPIVRDDVYRRGIVLVGGKRTYPCTDSHYHHEDEFWYFWNPAQKGCPLEEGRDYERLDADLEILPNTQLTYPEYSRLVDEHGTVRIDVLMGMDDEGHGRNPLTSKDSGAAGYRDMRKALLDLGYSARRWSNDEVADVTGELSGKSPFVEELTRDGLSARVEVRLFFGPSGMDEDSKAFHYFFRDALRSASVVIYDGHSGLSEYLDPAGIEKREKFELKPDKSRYQIYFFNSCSSYPYYNDLYFARKRTASDPRGTKNLDIVTNGLATAWEIPHETDMLLVRAIDDWATGLGAQSYQSLIDAIDSDNLTGVNGDEDND